MPTTVINQAAAPRDPTNNGQLLRVLFSAPAAAAAARVLSGAVPTLAWASGRHAIREDNVANETFTANQTTLATPGFDAADQSARIPEHPVIR